MHIMCLYVYRTYISFDIYAQDSDRLKLRGWPLKLVQAFGETVNIIHICKPEISGQPGPYKYTNLV